MRDGIVETFAKLMCLPGVMEIILMMVANEAVSFGFVCRGMYVRDEYAREVHEVRQITPFCLAICINLADTQLKSYPQIKATEKNRATIL